MCGHGECNHVGDPSIEWIIDTSATYHCVPRRQLFTTYRGGDFGNTKMGNKSVSQIVGIGDFGDTKIRNKSVSQIVGIGEFVVQSNTGCILTLKDMRHIANLRMNLLAFNVLDKDRYDSRHKDG